MIYLTRSRVQTLKTEEAAQALVELSRSSARLEASVNDNQLPHDSPKMVRRLSHNKEAYERAMKLAPQTKHGDTILINFCMDRYHYATVEYMRNENDVMVVHTIHEPYHEIQIPWTYEVTDFPFYKNRH